MSAGFIHSLFSHVSEARRLREFLFPPLPFLAEVCSITSVRIVSLLSHSLNLAATMTLFHRRAFFRASAAGLAATWFAGHGSAADAPVEIAPEPRPVLPLDFTKLTPHDTLFLTWQRDPTTTITVQWIAPPSDVIPAVRVAPRYGPAQWTNGTVLTKPFGNTDLKVYRCEFVGLTPGTEYIFQIGTASQVYCFRTMPAKATNTFTWVSGGDSGIGADAIATNILAAKQEPNFVLIAGDLGYDNGTSAKVAVQFIVNYSKHMIDPQGRLIPLVTCIGNHEVRGGYKGRRSDATYYLPLFDGLYQDTTYNVLDFGDYLSLVLLDTGHVSSIEGEQTLWLEGVLRERQDRPHLFVANHVPAYPSYRNPVGREKILGVGELQRRHWSPLFERYRVDAVLEHHDHTFKRTHPLTDGRHDKYGVPYLGDGSWGKLRTPVPPEKRPYLAKVAKAYHMTVQQLEGDQRFHVAMENGSRLIDVYTTTGKRPAKRG